MAETFVSVSPSKPAAATPTIIYTAPGGVDYALVLSLIAANNTGSGGTSDTITVKKIASAGAAGDANVEILADVPVGAQESFLFSEKLLLAASEAVAVESSAGNVVFTLSMLESTP